MNKLWAVCLISMTATSLNAQFSFTNRSSWLANHTVYSGVAMAVTDMNADGLDDIVRIDQSSKMLIDYQPAVQNQFTGYSYGPLLGRQWSICIADVDANGFNDVFTGGNNNGLKLLKANSTGTAYTLTTITQDPIFLQGSNFADIDNDGDADIFACHDNSKSHPYRNNGAGSFTLDYSLIDAASTVPSDNSGNYGSVWTDFDNDHDIDLYISKCRAGVNNPNDGRRLNLLFRNNGDGTFTDVAQQAGLRPFAQSWSTDFADIDNDGDMDCFVITHDVPSMLYRNNGDGTFTDITLSSGLSNAFSSLGPGIQCRFADFDNDGFVDLITTTVGLGYGLFHNNGDLTFTSQSGAFPGVSYMQSLATGDLNNDGFVDVMAGFAEGYNTPSTTVPDALFINNGNSNNYLKARLFGVESNRNGIGARLELYGDWGVQIREVRSGESYGIMHSMIQHFGIGDLLVIDSLIVRWPSGIVDKFENPSPNQTMVLEEGLNCQPGFGFSYQGDGLVFTFADQSTVAANTWLWDFGDGATSSAEAPGHTFPGPGSYNVCLTVSGHCGSGTICEPVNIFCTPPDAIFGKTDNNLTLSFQDQSLNDPVEWFWTFGDGESSTDQNPVHVFPGPGDYFVCLIVTDKCGQTSSTCSLITVGCDSTEADFTFETEELWVFFTDASTEDATVWKWNFGDGETSTQSNPSHKFDEPGTYQVCLTVTGVCGDETTCVQVTVSCPAPSVNLEISGEDLTYFLSANTSGASTFKWTVDGTEISILDEVYYTFPESGAYEICLQAGSICGITQKCTTVNVTCPLPVADFEYQLEGLSLTLTGQSTGAIDSLTWAFGDGQGSSEVSPNHSYSAPGTFEVCLTAFSACGSSQSCQTLTVTCPAPQAAFDFEADNLILAFSNQSVGAPDSLSWDFGDGTESTLADPVHVFSIPGAYQVCLTAFSVCGQTQSCQTLTVTCPAPQAAFGFEVDKLILAFSNQSVGAPDSLSWDFGDGTGSTLADPVHVFSIPGTYQVCLTAFSVCGQTQSCQSITVTCPVPQAAFDFEADDLSLQFNNLSVGVPDSLIWDFGDGTGSAESDPIHTYFAPGAYQVCLTVTSICGTTQICQQVTVSCLVPQALFSPSGIGLNQVFLDVSTNAPTSWFWDFGDGSNSTDQNPFHVFAQAGNYNICLTASNACGENTHCQTVTVTTTVTLDPDLQKRITIAPNPTISRFRVEMEGPPKGVCILTIMTPDGALARQIRNVQPNQEIILDDWPAGIYFLYFTWSGGETAVKRLGIAGG